jgi:carboxymethylenebutenolidase
MDAIEIKTDDGLCPSFVFHPDGAGPWPGVIMFMDGIGMRPALHEMGARLAKAGYYVLLPDLFYRAGPYTAADPKKLFTDPAMIAEWREKFFSKVNVAKTMDDTRAFLAHLAAQKNVIQPKVGVTGYCMGGRMSLSAAGTFPDRIVAAAAYHPGGLATDAPDSPHLLAPKIRARVYVGGAMEDQSFSEEEKHRLDIALSDAHVDHVVETYQAKHGWVPSDTPVHDAAQTERHWQTLLDLFAGTLRAKSPA